MTENEALKRTKMCIGISSSKKIISSFKLISDALEELQTYRAIENELKEKYHANVDIPLLMKYFIDTVFEGEKHEGFCILTNEDRAMWDAYKELGTVEDIQQKLAELKQWHTTVINDSIKNSFANSSTSICHNCDHKDEYIMELEAELQALKEKAEPKKPNYEGDGYYNGELVLDTWICPNCGKSYEVDYDNYDYCPNCGQNIDHSGLTEDD